MCVCVCVCVQKCAVFFVKHCCESGVAFIHPRPRTVKLFFYIFVISDCFFCLFNGLVVCFFLFFFFCFLFF